MGPLTELHVADVALVRGERMVQRALNFRVIAGHSIVIGGRNGAGKTSLLRAIAGLLEPRSGSIVLRLSDGRALASGEDRGPFVGWIGHLDAIKPQLTPAEHLEFHLRYHRRKRRIADALTQSGLTELRDVPAQYLSTGQQRRIAFARLILVGRPLWLLDEPLSTLDPHGKNLVRDLITRHCAEGGIVLAASHEPLGTETQVLELT
ncbi:MAG TPA: heme ABC exporter ATP-binding protein CcmA [Rhizomicrobium sp.]